MKAVDMAFLLKEQDIQEILEKGGLRAVRCGNNCVMPLADNVLSIPFPESTF